MNNKSKNITAGIDFGNQNCVLAVPSDRGVDIILNQSSRRLTPTMVTYGNDRRYSGEFSQHHQIMNIKGTITQIKRLVALPFDSTERETIAKMVPYNLVKLVDGTTGIEIQRDQETLVLHPEQIIAYLFQNLLDIIKANEPNIDQLVLTVSPWWTERQRRAILNAAKIANIRIASLINSTTAAAISYSKIHSDRLPSNADKSVNVVFIDFGDSSMNVAVAAISQTSVEMKSLAYDKTIGGLYFTEPLLEYLLQKVEEKYKINPRSNLRAMLRFREATEKAKKTLSVNPVVLFEIPSLMNDIDISFQIKRNEYTQLIQNLLNRIADPINDALSKANLSQNMNQIAAVEVLGGGSRIPAVRAKIKEIFGCEPLMSLDLDECFAIGAGYMAAHMSGYNIGVEVKNNNLMYPIDAIDSLENKKINVFEEFSKIPSEKIISIRLENGDSSLTFVNQESNELGKLNFEADFNDTAEIHISVSITAPHGFLQIKNVFYKDLSNEENAINIPFNYLPSMNMNEQEIKDFSIIEEKMCQKDELEHNLERAKNELESLIFKAENIFNSDKVEFIDNDKNIEEMKEEIAKIHNWFEENEYEHLDLSEYKTRIGVITELLNPIIEKQKKYQNVIDKLSSIKQTASNTLDMIKKDTQRIALKESVELQTDIPQFLSKLDKVLDLQKREVIEINCDDIEKNCIEFEKKADKLRKIQITKMNHQQTQNQKQAHKKKKISASHRKKSYNNDDPWSQFNNGIFGSMWGDPRRQKRKNHPNYFFDNYNDSEYNEEYDEEYEESNEEDENIRQQKARNEEIERRNAAFLEKKRQAVLKQQEERKKAIEKARLEEEQRIKALQEAEKRKREMLLEAQKKKAAEVQERQRRAQIAEEERRKMAQKESEERMAKEEMIKEAQIEVENRKKEQLEQQEHAKNADRVSKSSDPWITNDWSSQWGDPWGFDTKPQRSQQQQQRRTAAPGFFSPWAF